MQIHYFILCTLVPLLISFVLTRLSSNNLRKNELFRISLKSLNIFLFSRLIYWICFGILTAAFLLALMESGKGGEQTRALIAQSINTGDRTPAFILSDMSNYLLPLIFISLFTAVIALGLIGRNVLKLMPEQGKLGVEFSRFRFTFVLLALSLIFPPLLFGSLLLL